MQENEPLAALLARVELGDEIPEHFIPVFPRQVDRIDRIDAADKVACGINIIAADLMQAHGAWFDRDVVVAITAAA